MNTNAFLASLAAHDPADRDEKIHRDNMIAFVASRANSWWQRATLEGHVTGSAWILDNTRTRALLLHHLKLNLWVQPGGHLDDDDATPAAGAVREAREETGIPHLALARDAVFDVDIHSIPARPGVSRPEPAHLHYDVRYLIIANEKRISISDESLGAKWIPLAELTLPATERSIARMAEKSLRLKQ